MPAVNRVESIAYDPSSLDDFIRTLRAIGLVVTQKNNTIDNVTYTHMAKPDGVSFDDGIFFKFEPAQEDPQRNSSIIFRISRNVSSTGVITGNQYPGNYSRVYKIPYVKTSYGGIIIRGLDFCESTYRVTSVTTVTPGYAFAFLPPINEKRGWEFAVDSGGNVPIAVFEYVGEEINNYSTIYRDYNRLAFATGSKNLFKPAAYYKNNFSILQSVSHRVFSAIFYGEEDINGNYLRYSQGTIFRDASNNEYYVVVGNNSWGKTYSVSAIKL